MGKAYQARRLDAARGTPSQRPGKQVTVVSREELGKFVIMWKLRKGSVSKAAPDGAVYQLYGMQVTGGYVYFHLYDLEKCVRHGDQVRVEATVCQKKMSDGTKFLYVDLHPANPLACATYTMKVYQTASQIPDPPPEKMYACPGKRLRGWFAFLPYPPRMSAE